MSKLYFLTSITFFCLLFSGCGNNNAPININRLDYIPKNAVKMAPTTDIMPPILHSNEWEKPVPVPGAINTAGGEDGPFIMPDGQTFYFFFTPDVHIPVEKQVFDGVTGIYVSKKLNGVWQEPERIMLSKKGQAVLDGCEFVQGNKMWFCTTREGYEGIHWFSAEYQDDKWQNWKNADKELKKEEFETGELHITSDGNELYFHSSKGNADGSYDIWVSKKANGEWQQPAKVAILNSSSSEGWPYVSEDQQELWFTRFYRGSPALYRSKKMNSQWGEPQLIVSQFAGEPTLDNEGNLYFTHHYYQNNEMIEADIYVAYKKK